MTCQVAVMNKTGIALAADSAATFGKGQKIYRAAEKLFQISQLPPVGLMLSGAAELMDMPWETIIKTYIRESDGRKFPRLEQYAEDFFRAVEASPNLFPTSLQADWFRASVRRYWKEMFLEPLAHRLGGDTKGSSRQASQFLGRLLAREIANWRQLPALELGGGYADTVIEAYGPVLDELEGEFFRPFRISKEFKQKFRTAIGLMYDRAWVHPDVQSGIVLAGMGEEEPFPVLQEFQVGPIAAGKLRYYKVGEGCVTREVTSIVAPFGVTEMVDLFYRGIDPGLEQRLYRIIERSLSHDPARARGGVGAARRKRIVADIQKAFAEDITGTYQDPLITAVEALPRHSLATMAEALVSLTALKLRMSVEMADTVGGAIDVAVLSSGDGFVWIKRANAMREATATSMTIP